MDFGGAAANVVLFPAIRKNIGPNLKALICGSAPLSVETQLFFMMLGIPVLQVYGLTETTAICTMDDPAAFRTGTRRPGDSRRRDDRLAITAKFSSRGPNVFPGYWQRPAETAKALAGGWFHTGDQGESDALGNWRITGRLKNLIILEFRPQCCARASGGCDRRACAGSAARGADRQPAQFSRGSGCRTRNQRSTA